MMDHWDVRLGKEASRDFKTILEWTVRRFGEQQARFYRDIILLAIDALANGPEPTGSKAREEIAPGIRTLHIARQGRPARHLLLYRVIDQQTIEIGRILHDSMELKNHLPGADN